MKFIKYLKEDGSVKLYETEEGAKVVEKRYMDYDDGYEVLSKEGDFLTKLQGFDFIPRLISSKTRMTDPDLEDYWGESFEEYTMVEEYIEGITILDWIKENKPSKEDKIEVFLEVLKCIDKIHSVGIVHKDIKPNNIVLKLENGNKKVYIIDFGISTYEGKSFAGVASNKYSCREQKTCGTPAKFAWDNYELGGLYKFMMGEDANKQIGDEFASNIAYNNTEIVMDTEEMIRTIENFYKI